MQDQLRLVFLGKPKFERNGQPLALTSVKGQALLAYLAVTRQAHSRSALAGLLWSDMPEADARTNLRVTLSQLRKVVGDVVIATRRTVELNVDSDIWLDVAVLEQAASNADDLATTADLYRGDFLDDFQVPEAELFEEWVLIERERLRQFALSVLGQLADTSLAQGDYVAGIKAARQLLSIEPWHEGGHRQLMTLLTADGQRSAALAQYETCQQLLAEELGVAPSEETTELFEQIREGTLSRGAEEQGSRRARVQGRRGEVSAPARTLPAFLSSAPPPSSSPAPFVARERELQQLDRHLAGVLEGQGRVVFVTGEAGQGKTSLMNGFARRIQADHTEVVVASGACNAYSGVGDPYLPFRDILGMLTGDVEARWASGAISQTHARQLWALLPQTIQALVEHGPDLVDVFVPGSALQKRASASAAAGAHWLKRLQELVETNRTLSGDREQRQLFEQFTNVLRHLAGQKPLLLLLDDLQWADRASINLLFHLGRRLGGSRILIVGAYRPSEVALGRSAPASAEQDGQHPLSPVVNELTRHFGDIQLDLAQITQAEGRGFIDALIDSRPNQLGETFRAAMFERTQGHPLFTVELLRDLQERGNLIQDDQKRWVEGTRLAWDTLPARVEAVIEQRVGRLETGLRDNLTVASVEGEKFTAQVMAQIQEIEERSALRQLSQELEQRHRLVREYEEITVGRRHLSRYQFRHALFQRYLYEGLGSGERRLLHRQVAQVLETLYDGYQDKITQQLAHHYLNANEPEQAQVYLVQAGDQARRVAALDEATRYYRIALERWPAEDQAGRAQTLRKLGECLWVAGHLQEALERFDESFALFEALADWESAGAVQRLIGRLHWERSDRERSLRHYQRALTILEQGPESVELAHAIGSISQLHMLAAEYPQAITRGEQALDLANRLEAEDVIVHVLNDMGVATVFLGDVERGVAMLHDSLNRALDLNLSHDVCRAYFNLGEVLQDLGRYLEARELSETLYAYAVRTHVTHKASSALVLIAELDWQYGQWGAALAYHQEIRDWLVNYRSLGLLKLKATKFFGQVYNDLGLASLARQEIEAALPVARRSGEQQTVIPNLGELVRTYAALGLDAKTIELISELNRWIDEADHLIVPTAVYMLFVCQWWSQTQPTNPYEARAALQRLERVDQQIGSPISATCLSEGRGYVTMAEATPGEAIESFRQAVDGWNDLGRPYDQARALNGLGQALTQTGEMVEAKHAFDQAWGLIGSLAAQLDDPELKASFLNSALVAEIRQGLTTSNSGQESPNP